MRARAPTKSHLPPRFERAPWAENRLIHLIGEQLHASVITPPFRPSIRLGARSPVLLLDDAHARPHLRNHVLGTLRSIDGSWEIQNPEPPGEVFRINGVWADSRAQLSHGDVVEKHDGAWIVSFDECGPADSGFGPLWHAYQLGVFSLVEGQQGKWQAVLRGGSLASGRDSIERLKAILASDLVRRLESLELHAWSNEGVGDWQAFIAQHLQLAKLAPFELKLSAPVPVEGAKLLAAVACTAPGSPTLEPFGSGTFWPGGDFFFRDANVAEWGWVTLAPGDWLRGHNGRRFIYEEQARADVAPTDGAVTPWCLLPENHWEHRPLERCGADWILRVESHVSRWSVSPTGVRRRLADESLGELHSWFDRVELAERNAFVFLPGRSPFFGGRCFPTTAPLTLEAVRIFVDELLQDGDVVGEALSAITEGSPSAAIWLTRLLGSYGRQPAVFVGGIDPTEGDRCGIFFITLRVRPWLDFHKDVPLLLSHPMMCRLERLELLESTDQITRIREALSSTGRKVELVQAHSA